MGNQTWEEVNRIEFGGSYGWPASEGPGTTPPGVEPITYYPNSGGSAVTGSAFYRGTSYPEEMVGDYFYSDFVTGAVIPVDGGYSIQG